MLEHVAPRILPVVEDLRTQNVPPNACMVVVAPLLQMVVSEHHGVEIFYLECCVIEARFAESDTEQAVVIDVVRTEIAAHERGHDVGFVTEVDLVGDQEAEARSVPVARGLEVRNANHAVADALDLRGAGLDALELPETLAIAASIER